MSMAFHPDSGVSSWSRVGKREHRVGRPRFAAELTAWNQSGRDTRLAIGNGRSYSDVGLCDRGNLIAMGGLDRFRSFDPETGILVAEAGVMLDAILETFVPRGFFLPVTPGTRFVTLGGAVANDVHGKNHHRAGTFGRHVRSIVLERSDMGRVRVSPGENPQLFAATIGGLGLTGIIVEVELQLQRIASSQLDVETIACVDLDALCDTLERSETGFEHSVAWIDCTARNGRGIVSRANWAETGPLSVHAPPRRSVPGIGVPTPLNPMTLKLFNGAYFTMGQMRAGRAQIHYSPFFYPLDAILNWNRLYGKQGFYQYQCVIPAAAGRAPLAALLAEIAASGEGSLLAVLKTFGDLPSPGMLSFPTKGLTLALDFRNRGAATLSLFDRLDRIVLEAGGRLYPAKDLRMPAALFRAGYPQSKQFEAMIDPCCRSDFWTRVAQ